MKHRYAVILLAVAFCLFFPRTGFQETAPRKLTLMVYMCGSNLESEGGAASRDIDEMVEAIDCNDMSLLVMAGGAARWSNGLDAHQTTILEIGPRGKRAVDTQPKLSMGDSDTLLHLLRFARDRYPADEYALVVWDHGTGPLEGVCLDELHTPDTLSLREIGSALSEANLPGKLKWIGFDACLMSTVEVANAMAPYAEYMIASEETEPDTGWDYAFLKGIESDGDSLNTLRRVIDLYMETPHVPERLLTLACTDLSKIEAVTKTMDAYFESLSKSVSPESFARLSNLRMASISMGRQVRGVGVDGYDLVDLKDLATRHQTQDSAKDLLDALEKAVTINGASQEGVGGLSVYHPMYNKIKYRENWSKKYGLLGFCPGYAKYIKEYATIWDSSELTDWQELITVDEGFDADDNNWFSVQLTPEQQANFSSAQLLALYPRIEESGGRGRFIETAGVSESASTYSPIYISNAQLNDDGLLTARYAGRALYVTDAVGNPVLGPLSYRLSADGETYYLYGLYTDTSGSEEATNDAAVLFACRPDGTDSVSVFETQVYDPLTETYSNRAALQVERYTHLSFDSLAAFMPIHTIPRPGFDEWWTTLDTPGSEYYHDYTGTIALDQGWRLRFFDFQQSGLQTYVAFQVTDVQQNTFMSELMPVRNPNLENIPIEPAVISEAYYDVSCSMVRDISPLNPTLSLCLEFTWRDGKTDALIDDVWLNGSRCANYLAAKRYVDINENVPESKLYLQISNNSLTGLEIIESVEIEISGLKNPLVFHPVDCDISDIAPKAGEPLAEAEHNGVTVQLTSLARGLDDAIDGVLHIVNHSTDSYFCDYIPALNGLTLQGECDVCRVPPGMDAYLGFKLYDSAYLSQKLTIKGKNSARLLTESHLLRRYASESIDRVVLMNGIGYDVDESWTLELEAPVSLASAGEVAAPRTLETASLLEGPVSVALERVLIADNGVALRLILRNDTDDDVCVLTHNRLLNGVDVDNEYPVTFYLSAHGLQVACLGIDTDYELPTGYEIGTIDLSFRCWDYSTPLCHIALKTPVMLGVLNGVYLSQDALDIVPVQTEDVHRIALLPSEYETGDFSLRLWASLENDFSFGAIAAEGLELGITMAVENHSDKYIDAVSTEFVFNGSCRTETEWIAFDIAPHSRCVRTWNVSMNELSDLDSLERLQCIMLIRESSDNGWGELLETIPIDVRFDRLMPIDPGKRTEALCEAEVDGVIWQLISAEIDPLGRLTGWLRATNTTGIQKEFLHNEVIVEGILGDDHLANVVLDSGSIQYIPFTFENNIRVSRPLLTIPGTTGYARPLMEKLLQRKGFHEIRQISFAMGMATWVPQGEAREAEQSFSFILPEPLPLDTATPAEDSKTLLLRNGDVTVWLDSVLLGDRGLSLALEMENAADHTITLNIERCFVDEYRVGSLEFTLNGSGCILAPHSTRIIDGSIEQFPFQTGETIQKLLMSWSLDYDGAKADTNCGETTITLKKPTPLLKTGGQVLSEEEYDVEPAVEGSGSEQFTLPLPLPERVHPKTLVAPISPEKASRFASGEVSICREVKSDEEIFFDVVSEEYFDSYAQEVVIIPLNLDAEGRVSARYSGLGVDIFYSKWLCREYTEEDTSIIKSTLYEFSQLYSDYAVQRSLDPMEIPDIVPVGLPWNYEEGMILDGGIRTTYTFVIKNTDGELFLLDSSVEKRCMSKDDPPEIAMDYPVMVQINARREYRDGNYKDVVSDYKWVSEGTDEPEEPDPGIYAINADTDEMIKLVAVYHIRYTDGTEEVIAQDFPK